MEKKDIISNYNYCILDFAVNDQFFLDNGLVSAEMLIAAYIDLIVKFKNTNCKPIFLILPLISSRNTLSSNVQKFIVNICAEYGITYVDVYDFINSLKGKYPVQCLMRDIAHLTSTVAQIVAAILTKSLGECSESSNFHTLRKYNFRIPEATSVNFTNYRREFRQTSAGGFEVNKALSISDSFIRITGENLLCGVFFFNTKDSGNVFFQTERGTIRKNFRVSSINMFFFRQFILPVMPLHNCIEVHLTSDDNCISEKTDVYDYNIDDQSEFEVVDFLICDKSFNNELDFLRCMAWEYNSKKLIQSNHQKEMTKEFKTRFTVLNTGIIDDLIRYKDENDNQCKQNTLNCISKVIRSFHNKKRDIILFGAGSMGQKFLEMQLFRDTVTFLVDNDPLKWDTQIDSFYIRNPNILLNQSGNLVFIASTFYDEIKCQITEMGFVENVDFFDARLIIDLLQNEYFS